MHNWTPNHDGIKERLQLSAEKKVRFCAACRHRANRNAYPFCLTAQFSVYLSHAKPVQPLAALAASFVHGHIRWAQRNYCGCSVDLVRVDLLFSTKWW